MSVAFERWLDALKNFQVRRAMGAVARPWDELEKLASQVEGLAITGLDHYAAAENLIRIERAGLHNEQREFDKAYELAMHSHTPPHVRGPARELIEANRELILGNVYLIRDENMSAAAQHFERAIAASGPTTVFVRGNAAINLGICQSLLGRHEAAIESYKLAAESYAAADREDKVAVALHSLGNAYRSLDKVDDGVRFLHEAVKLFIKYKDHMGIWNSADDLARAYLTIADQRPQEHKHWLDLAVESSGVASFASTKVWSIARNEPGRLADLSDQLVNFTVTRCDIADLQEDPFELLGTLAMMKGRIRLSTSPLSEKVLTSQSADFREAIEAGVPLAYFNIVADALEHVAAGKTIAFLDQFALHGNQLIMGYVIISSGQKIVGAFHNGLPEASTYEPTQDLRGRSRASGIVKECQHLISSISSHAQRCAMVLPRDPEMIDDAARQQLLEWAQDLEPSLKRLGDLFFPEEVLAEFRKHSVEHLVLCVDPLFVRIPYTALIGESGAIVDEPWSLSLVTASTEVARIGDRQGSRATTPQELCWFGPDKDVNERLGGDEESHRLKKCALIAELREGDASLDRLIESLSSGRWCHFRGHGRWTGLVQTSGPVLANHEVLSAEEYSRIAGIPGFLFTAACLTGFGDSIGTEAFGSLVDYDKAGLFGAVLTSWPIHAHAATVFTGAFYEALRKSEDVARALKQASRKTRQLMPHPYLWAPFSLVGGWAVERMVRWVGGE